MCMVCDGFSAEEIEFHNDLVIQVHGFLMLQVECGAPWTYTIGALESWDQPELIVVDIDAEAHGVLLKAIAEDYLLYGEIHTDTLELLDVELVPVHEIHLRGGLVAAWEDRYSMAATGTDFLQVVPGPTWFCDCCAAKVRRLDDPDIPSRSQGNRARRRARSRRNGGAR